MPTLSSGLTDSLARLRATPGSGATSSFVNNVTSKNRLDPGVQSRSALSNTDSQRGAQQTAFQTQLQKYGDWSKQQSSILRQGQLARQAKEATRQQNLQLQQDKNSRMTAMPMANEKYANFNAPTNSAARQKIVRTALSYVGTPYAWGGGSATTRVSRGVGKGTQNVIGVDCSGLTSYAYGAVGIRLPRYSTSQYATGVKTNVRNAQPGDLIGWGRGGHVAVYIGNGQIAEAVQPGKVARVRSLRPGENAFAVRLRLPGE